MTRPHLESYAAEYKAGLQQPKPSGVTPPRTMINSTTTKPYRPSKWHVRAGADDNQKFTSLKEGA